MSRVLGRSRIEYRIPLEKERKKEKKTRKDKNIIRKDIESMFESSIDDFGTEI